MHRNTIPLFILGLCLTHSVVGCDDSSGIEEHQLEEIVEGDDGTELEELALRYLHQPLATPADAEPIFQAIGQLDADEQRKFRDHVIELQLADLEVTDELRREIEINRLVHEKRLEQGIGMLDASAQEVDAITAEVAASLPDGLETPRAACTTVAFPDTVTEQNYCALGAIAAFGYDRKENDAVAFPACDYRFKFTTQNKRFSVAGHNAATLCALNYNNGSLLSSHSSGTQYALVGYNWMTWCNVINPSNVATGLRIF